MRNTDSMIEQLVEEALSHKEHLRNWLSSRFSDVKDPEDVVAESYARLIKYHRREPVGNTRSFLFVTARNLALNEIYRSRYADRFGLLSESAGAPSSAEIPPPHKFTSSAEEVHLLREAIESLPRRCRQVITLRELHGLSHRDVAGRLGISVHTVQNQRVIGLRKCREFFRKRGIIKESRE